jgi:hypothetical protein
MERAARRFNDGFTHIGQVLPLSGLHEHERSPDVVFQMVYERMDSDFGLVQHVWPPPYDWSEKGCSATSWFATNLLAAGVVDGGEVWTVPTWLRGGLSDPEFDDATGRARQIKSLHRVSHEEHVAVVVKDKRGRRAWRCTDPDGFALTLCKGGHVQSSRTGRILVRAEEILQRYVIAEAPLLTLCVHKDPYLTTSITTLLAGGLGAGVSLEFYGHGGDREVLKEGVDEDMPALPLPAGVSWSAQHKDPIGSHAVVRCAPARVAGHPAPIYLLRLDNARLTSRHLSNVRHGVFNLMRSAPANI